MKDHWMAYMVILFMTCISVRKMDIALDKKEALELQFGDIFWPLYIISRAIVKKLSVISRHVETVASPKDDFGNTGIFAGEILWNYMILNLSLAMIKTAKWFWFDKAGCGNAACFV